MVSKASEDFPEPDRPVNTINLPRGRSSVTSLRLCSRLPGITSLSVPTDPFYESLRHGRSAGLPGGPRECRGLRMDQVDLSRVAARPPQSLGADRDQAGARADLHAVHLGVRVRVDSDERV